MGRREKLGYQLLVTNHTVEPVLKQMWKTTPLAMKIWCIKMGGL